MVVQCNQELSLTERIARLKPTAEVAAAQPRRGRGLASGSRRLAALQRMADGSSVALHLQGLQHRADATPGAATPAPPDRHRPRSPDTTSPGARSSHDAEPMQLQKYSVYRKLPLMQNNKTLKRKNAIMNFKNALREKFPDNQSKTSTDPEGRGPLYVQALAEKMAILDPEGRAAGANLSDTEDAYFLQEVDQASGHVAGISTQERGRSGSIANGMNGLERKAGAQIGSPLTWIGAHLVKREWGGEDNLWNVVAWPQSTEDSWAARFEDPLDNAFQREDISDAAIELQVIKDDEVWQQGAVADAVRGMVDERYDAGSFLQEDLEPSETGNMSGLDAFREMMRLRRKGKIVEYIEGKSEKVRLDHNDAVEKVPFEVQAQSSLTPIFRMGAEATQWNRARILALAALAADLEGLFDQATKHFSKTKAIHPNALAHAKTRDETYETETAKRERNRTTAHRQEVDNLRPTNGVDRDEYFQR